MSVLKLRMWYTKIVSERKINFLHLGLYSDSKCGILINVKEINLKKKKVEKNCI